MPYGHYEVVEDFLNIADILVTDWSSIGIDFLPLGRPAIFLDVPAPFKKGFELGPEHRYGDVVKSFNALKKALEKYLDKPAVFDRKHNKDMKMTTQVAYGETLDGHSLDRYFDRLEQLLNR
jgi:CDP-glycerol glycerophosphotransferase